MLQSHLFRRALKTTTPVFFGYIAIGIPFGLMLVNAGYSWWLAPLMSMIMYAGAGEYIAVGLFAAGTSLSTILVAELLINVRHIVYGLSLISKFKDTGRWKPFLIFALTDETYALLTCCTIPQEAPKGAYLGTIALLDYLYWIAGSTIGAIAGTVIPFSFAGVDFALTALFAVMLINQIRASHDVIPPVIGCCTTAGAIILSSFGLLPSEHILIIALALGLSAIVLFRGRNFMKSRTGGAK
ncbi:MAG: AzlC family ABC transporter permease [Treponema sp.]|nr:AzlC family ABC transporter permease [Treponema sp.]